MTTGSEAVPGRAPYGGGPAMVGALLVIAALWGVGCVLAGSALVALARIDPWLLRTVVAFPLALALCEVVVYRAERS